TESVNSESEEEEETPKENTETESVPPTSSESNTESVEASANGTAAGKIIETFISPYSAKYSYNNVYMKNTSGINIDLKSELSAKLKFKINKGDSPEVLIVHTHATECYMKEKRDYYTNGDAFRTTDNNDNVTHMGEIIANKLKAAGIGVIHDKTQHDYPAYTGSYSRSEVTIKEYLKKYPSIKIVLDLHRDSITVNENDRSRPVAEIDGKRAAQVMLLMGSESGSIKNHPEWRENFRLAIKLQQTMEVMYPGLARPIVLASKLYNQNLTTGSMLLELGTESNLKNEAEYSAELVGNALASLLNTLR
ncbi:MAG: stage II sporulation protein P, partial [Clostridia bacterium]|nr:stage II sporulation protein P [Clostridia bacterium]